MKNKLTIIFILLISIVYFINVEEVSASVFNVHDSLIVYKGERSRINDLVVVSSSNESVVKDGGTGGNVKESYTPYMYYVTVGGVNYSVYCQDPHKYGFPGTNHVIDSEYLVSNTRDYVDVKYFDMASLRMNTYAEANRSGLTNEEFYTAMLIATRTLTFSFAYYDSPENIIEEAYYADQLFQISMFRNLAAYWNELDPLTEAKVDVINANYGGPGKILNNNYYTQGGIYYTLTVQNHTSRGAAVYNFAKEIYLAGIDAMHDMATGTTFTTIASVTPSTSKEVRVDDIVTKTVTLFARDFAGDGKIYDFNAKSSSSNVTITCTHNDNTIPCTNYSGSLNSDDKIIVTIKSKLVDTVDDTVKYTIDYNLSDDSLIEMRGFIIYATTRIGSGANPVVPQRFVVFDDQSGFAGAAGGTISASKNNCNYEITVPTDCIDVDGEESDRDFSGSITATENVEKCIINNDENIASQCHYDTNTPNGMANVSDNKFCTVSCTESYEKITFPGVQYSQAGRYFKIGANIDGTKTCYTDAIDYDLFYDYMDDIFDETKDAYKKLVVYNVDTELYKTQIEAQEKILEEQSDLLDDYVDQLRSCSAGQYNVGWTMLFPNNPDVEYKYDEVDYMTLAAKANGKDDMVLISDETSDAKYEYCSGLDGTDCKNITTVNAFDYVNLPIYDKDGSTTVRVHIPQRAMKYSMATITKSLEYATPENFYLAIPSGVIIYSEDGTITDDEGNELQVELIDGLPVSLVDHKVEIPGGKYQFSFDISNLGEFYSDYDGNQGCSSGRLDDVLEEYKSDTSVNKTGFTGNYVCSYTPCPDCPTTGDTWQWVCVSCIVDGSFNLFFRTISTNASGTSGTDNFNPNDRDVGYNWNVDSAYQIIKYKAQDTLLDIYSTDENTYDNDPILTVTLTPTIANEIKKQNEGTSYTDDTLDCYDYNINGVKFGNIFCYSNLLDKWALEYSTNFEFTELRNRNINSDVTIKEPSSPITVENYWIGYQVGSVTSIYSVGGPAWK